jgi:drug/metabolite transporter (DMT)-like permease
VNPKAQAYAAYVYVAIIWGTTYYAIRIAVLDFPPFLMAAVRQLAAFVLIAFIALALKGRPDLSRQNLLRHALIGFLMITVGNGIVSAAERVIPSGVAALICSIMPIAVVLLNLMGGRSERLGWRIVLGLLLGLVGVALIFRNDLAALHNPHYLAGILLTLVGTVAWAGGSILSKKWKGASNPMFDAALQVGFGGLFLLLFSPAVDNYRVANWHSGPALTALIYLIIFGSVIAFTAYRYALAHLPVGLVTSYAYINPLVAVILGYFTGEKVSGWTLLSFIAIISGVALVNRGYYLRQRNAQRVLSARAAVTELE